jgi:Cell cycle and development regulator
MGFFIFPRQNRIFPNVYPSEIIGFMKKSILRIIGSRKNRLFYISINRLAPQFFIFPPDSATATTNKIKLKIMNEINHKTIFVLDHTPYFGISSEDFQDLDIKNFKSPISKSLWTCSVGCLFELIKIFCLSVCLINF